MKDKSVVQIGKINGIYRMIFFSLTFDVEVFPICSLNVSNLCATYRLGVIFHPFFGQKLKDKINCEQEVNLGYKLQKLIGKEIK